MSPRFFDSDQPFTDFEMGADVEGEIDIWSSTTTTFSPENEDLQKQIKEEMEQQHQEEEIQQQEFNYPEIKLEASYEVDSYAADTKLDIAKDNMYETEVINVEDWQTLEFDEQGNCRILNTFKR